MNRWSLLARMAVLNLRAHRIKSAAVAVIVALGTFVAVMGLSMVRSMSAGMEEATVSSLTGHVQVWSDDAPDDVRLIVLGEGLPDIGELDDFAEVRAQLEAIDGVGAVVPMASGFASTTMPGLTDRVVDGLKEALGTQDKALIEARRMDVQRVAHSIVESLERESAVSASDGERDERLEIGRRVASDAYWQDADIESLIDELELSFVPIGATGETFFIEYMATDPTLYTQTFSRFRMVDGEPIPQGKKGLLLTRRFYENAMKHIVARELDDLLEAAKAGAKFQERASLRGRAEALPQHASTLARETRPAQIDAVTSALREHLGSDETEMRALYEAFLTVDDTNITARHAFFEDKIAPAIPLFAIEPGDEIVLRAFSKSGYLRSARVKFYGTFQYEGLEGSALAGTPIIDLITFRSLYGKMSEDQLDELDDLREEMQIESIEAGSVEDALFGSEESDIDDDDDAEDEGEPADPSETDENDENDTDADADIAEAGGEDDPSNGPDQDPVGEPAPDTDTLQLDVLTAEELAAQTYSTQEMQGGLVTNIAVLIEEGADVDAVIARIDTLQGLQATNWRVAAGIVGQFATVMTVLLWLAIALIFFVAGVILNNAILLSMLQRTTEFGTLRAIGAQRAEVIWMVVLEASVTAAFGGLIGGAAAVAVVTWLGSVGIPAPAATLKILFGGTHLYPSVAFVDVVGAGVAGRCHRGVVGASPGSRRGPRTTSRSDEGGLMGVVTQIAVQSLVQGWNRYGFVGGMIALVTALFLCLVAFSNGTRHQFIESASVVGTGHITLGGWFKASRTDAIPILPDAEAVRRVAADHPEVVNAFVRERRLVTFYSDSGSAIAQVITGVDPAVESKLLNYLRPATDDTDLTRIAERNAVVLAAQPAADLEVRVGDVITARAEYEGGRINTADLVVVGIVEDVGMLTNFTYFASRETVQQLYQQGPKVGGLVYVELSDGVHAPRVMDALRSQLTANDLEVMPYDGRPYFWRRQDVQRENWTGSRVNLTTWRDEVSYIAWILDALNAVSALVIGVLLVIVIVGILNTMLMAVTERRKELGTLRAMGMSRMQLLGMVVLEGGLLGFVTGTLGAVLGAGIAVLINQAQIAVPTEVLREILLVDVILLRVELNHVLVCIVGVTVLSATATIWPAARAARLPPVTAIQGANS